MSTRLPSMFTALMELQSPEGSSVGLKAVATFFCH